VREWAGEDTQPIPHHESRLPKDHPLYRPRHGRQRTALVCAVMFFFTPIVGLCLFGEPPAIENRALHPFPSLSQGWGFFTALGPWAVDNLPFRLGAIQASDKISRGLFGEPPSLGAGGSEVAPGATVGDAQPHDTVYPKVIEGRDGWMYYGEDMHAKCQPRESLDDVLAEVIRFKAAVEKSGRRFVLVVPPDKSTAVPDRLPDQYAGKDCAAALRDRFWPRITSQAGAVDLRSTLNQEAARTGSPLYFPQDSHWTFAGGLLMVRAVVDTIESGVDQTWKVAKSGPYSGEADLPPLLGRTGVDSTDRYSLAPDGTVDRTQQGLYDARKVTSFHTDGPVTGMIGGRTTWFGDSFTTYATPFIAAAFTDASIIQEGALEADPARAAQYAVDSDTIVVEMVERGIAPGVSVLLQPAVLDAVATAVAAHPRK